jgi:hypothetical protein
MIWEEGKPTALSRLVFTVPLLRNWSFCSGFAILFLSVCMLTTLGSCCLGETAMPSPRLSMVAATDKSSVDVLIFAQALPSRDDEGRISELGVFSECTERVQQKASPKMPNSRLPLNTHAKAYQTRCKKKRVPLVITLGQEK